MRPRVVPALSFRLLGAGRAPVEGRSRAGKVVARDSQRQGCDPLHEPRLAHQGPAEGGRIEHETTLQGPTTLSRKRSPDGQPEAYDGWRSALWYGGAVKEGDDRLRAARAADADRDVATQRLIRACSEGRLTLGEFEKRVEAVLAATTGTDLDRATDDLPVLAVAIPLAQPSRDRRWSVSVVGGLHRRGAWQIPRHMIHVSLIGGTSIDLGDAEMSAAETTITLVSLIGGADLRVPKAVRSELSGFTVFGKRRVTGSPSPLRDGPLVHLRAFSVIGGATIRPSGSRWRRFALTR